MYKRIGAVLLVLLLLLLVVVAANTVRHTSRQLTVAAATPPLIDANAVAERLGGGVRFRTISLDDDPNANLDQFEGLHTYLEQQFVNVHRVLKRETVGEASLLYTWTGSDASAKPILLMAHQDVVPIAPNTLQDWLVDPFSGALNGGFIWGRGAWDDKGNLFSMLEAVEMLVKSGFQPRQTIYFAFGHDEEVGGTHGAMKVAALLQQRGVKLDFVLDEGLLIGEGLIQGADKPVALIGIAEKGYLNLALNTNVIGGHSSMPPRHTAIGLISHALASIEDHQMPATISGATREMLDTLAPELDVVNRVLLSNIWLFGPLMKMQLALAPSTNAMLRTTAALTVVNGGNKSNVLPYKAEANVNFRILPGDTSDAVLAHVKAKVANDAVQITKRGFLAEPLPAARTDAPSYLLINRTVRELFPGTIVGPGLMVAATDSRHFAALADNVYRFSPVRAKPEDLARFHGTNERISIANYVELITFYRQLMLNASSLVQ